MYTTVYPRVHYYALGMSSVGLSSMCISRECVYVLLGSYCLTTYMIRLWHPLTREIIAPES